MDILQTQRKPQIGTSLPENVIIDFLRAINGKDTNKIQNQLNPSIFPISADQYTVNLGLKAAANNNDFNMLKFLLTLPTKYLSPNQDAVNEEFRLSLFAKNLNLAEFLLNLPHGSIKPDQEGINLALRDGIIRNNLEMVNTLFEILKGKLTPNQAGMNEGLDTAVRNSVHNKDFIRMINLLFNLPKESPCPNQKGVDAAFHLAAAQYHDIEIVKHFLKGSLKNLRPTQDAIKAALIKIESIPDSNKYKYEATVLLENY